MGIGSGTLNRFREVDFIPVSSFLGIAPIVSIAGGAAGTAVGYDADTAEFNLTKAAATARISTLVAKMASLGVTGAGLNYIKEMAAAGYAGLVMETAGDDVNHIMRIPNAWDRRHPVNVRVVWSSASSTAADTIDWKFLYELFSPLVGGLESKPSVALSTAIPQDSHVGLGNAGHLYVTDNGVINGGVIGSTRTHMGFLVEMDAFAADLTEDKFLIGVEFEYTPRIGRGLHRKGRVAPD